MINLGRSQKNKEFALVTFLPSQDIIDPNVRTEHETSFPSRVGSLKVAQRLQATPEKFNIR